MSSLPKKPSRNSDTNDADLPTSAAVSSEVRDLSNPSDSSGGDHDDDVGDTDRVADGNIMPATSLLALWPLLPTLRLVVELGGVRAASAALKVQPPAVSKTIRQLEALLKEPLFHRVGRGLLPTARAKALHQAVRTAMRDVDDVVSDERPLRIAVHPFVLAQVLAADTVGAAGKVLVIHEADEALRRLRSGGVDVVVGVGAVGENHANVDVVDAAAIAEVEIGGDAGTLEGEDVAAAVAGAAAGFSGWIPEAEAPPGVPHRQQRARQVWVATRSFSMGRRVQDLRQRIIAALATPKQTSAMPSQRT